MEEMGTHRWRSDEDQFESYILYLEKEGKGGSYHFQGTGVHQGIFSYLVKERKINRDPAEFLRAPKLNAKYR